METQINAVVYIDGSARPNPGKIGFGTHGYLYTTEGKNAPKLDGGYFLTNKGYKKVLKDDVVEVSPTMYLDFIGTSPIEGTNNRAEVTAFFSTLKELQQYKPKQIHFLTDSEYVKKGLLEWCKGWERNGWIKQDGLPVVNADLWMDVYTYYKQLLETGQLITIEWVRGHNNDIGNTKADALAVIGMNYSTDNICKDQFAYTDPKGYWKSGSERHPFLNFKRVYFNTTQSYNIAGSYFQAEPGGGKAADFIIGKRIPETGFAVVRLYEPEKIIEDVKAKQISHANGHNSIVMLKLDRIYSKEMYPYLEKHGKYCLLGDKKSRGLNFLDNQSVTIELNPTNLSMRAVETFNFLEDMLVSFKTYQEKGFDIPENHNGFQAHNVTSTFYDIESKLVKKEIVEKYILKSDFTSALKNISVTATVNYKNKVDTVELPVLFGLDIPPRNNLKKLEEHEPKIYLITWRDSERTLRYAFIIECKTGIGIWSNYFADRIFLN
jgi:ribonuclease HI